MDLTQLFLFLFLLFCPDTYSLHVCCPAGLGGVTGKVIKVEGGGTNSGSSTSPSSKGRKGRPPLRRTLSSPGYLSGSRIHLVNVATSFIPASVKGPWEPCPQTCWFFNHIFTISIEKAEWRTKALLVLLITIPGFPDFLQVKKNAHNLDLDTVSAACYHWRSCNCSCFPINCSLLPILFIRFIFIIHECLRLILTCCGKGLCSHMRNRRCRHDWDEPLLNCGWPSFWVIVV